jgi:C-terminal processing protease CtpA/Prc
VEASDSFDVLADELDRYYSFFALKKVNWQERTAQYRAAGQTAKSAEEFVATVQPLLAELKDLHVGIELPNGKQVPTFISAVDRNFDARAIAEQLTGVKQIGRMGFIGRTAEGFGYVAIGTLSADRKTTDEMLAAFDSLLDSKGLIIDLRPNNGGSEPIAQQFVARLIDKPLTYASNQFRSGAAYDDLITVGTRQVIPGPGSKNGYQGNVVALIGPGCVSSGEGFALMLAALPKRTLIGQPTRGASGNPRPVSLPNGVKVNYSTWVPLQMNGKPFEGIGIAPDVLVDDDPRGTKGLQAAINKLK